MYVLGVETSCDETSCAVVRGRKVLSHATVSSLKQHKRYGGVVPEIATRNHLKVIDTVFLEAVTNAEISPKQIGAIGVTSHPGLIGALVVGVNFAKALALALNKPLLAINHLYAHLYAAFLNSRDRIPLPFIGLVVSGGHTDIFLVRDFNKITIVGRTRDDAAGEVFDKVARAFGLGYPGGAVIDKLYREEYKQSYPLKCGSIGLDFSFSGIKTAVIYKKASLEKTPHFNKTMVKKLLSSFQESIVTTIVSHVIKAVEKYNIKCVVCGGGVIANRRLRTLLMTEAQRHKIKLFLSPLEFTGDNAAMIAGLASYLITNCGQKGSHTFKACPN